MKNQIKIWITMMLGIILINVTTSCEKEEDDGDGIPTKEISLGGPEDIIIKDGAIQYRKELKLGYIMVDQMITDPNGNTIPQTVVDPVTGRIDTVRIAIPITANYQEERLKELVNATILDLKAQILDAIHKNPEVRTKFVFPGNMVILSKNIKSQISGAEESFISRLEFNGINDLSALITGNKDKTIDELVESVLIGTYEENLLKAAAIDFFENDAISYLRN